MQVSKSFQKDQKNFVIPDFRNTAGSAGLKLLGLYEILVGGEEKQTLPLLSEKCNRKTVIGDTAIANSL